MLQYPPTWRSQLFSCEPMAPDNFHEIIGALRPKFHEPPAARLAHFRLAAQSRRVEE
jgi:hypothetical protein